MFWWVLLKFIIFLYVNLYQFEFQKSFIRLNLLVLPIFLIFKHTFSNYCYVYLFFFYNMNKFECSAYFYILVKTYIFQSLLSNFFFRETIIKKSNNARRTISELFLRSVFTDISICLPEHETLPWELPYWIKLLPWSHFYLTLRFIQFSTSSRVPRTQVIHY